MQREPVGCRIVAAVAFGLLLIEANRAIAVEALDRTFDDVAPILAKYCSACHNAEEREADLLLETYADLESSVGGNPLVVPHRPELSRLLSVIEGSSEPVMPPDDNPRPSEEEIAIMRSWIAAGAVDGAKRSRETPPLNVPQIPSELSLSNAPITALALSPDGGRVAIGRFTEVEVLDSATRRAVYRIRDLPGKIYALHFSVDGSCLAVATGVDGLGGRADVYHSDTGSLRRSMTSGRDAFTDAELSPDGTLLATSSFDGTVTLWEIATGQVRYHISGHHGAVFDVAFSPDGKLLASASADATVKLWDVASGARLDTLSQPEAEQYAVAFDSKGTRLAAGGADSRVRVWSLQRDDSTFVSDLLVTRVAHDGAVTDLGYVADGAYLVTAGDDRAVKAWEGANLITSTRMETQQALVNALAVPATGSALAVGFRTGDWRLLDAPALALSLQAGSKAHDDAINVPEISEPDGDSVICESEPNDSPSQATSMQAPGRASGCVWPPDGQSEEDRDFFRFSARAGERLILEVHAARSGSELDSFLEILDENGNRLPQVVLQAVRDSYLKYRSQDSDELNDFRLHNWEEMEINEYVYLNGDVMRLWFYPRGVDSGYMMYPGRGKRHAFFSTTPLAHALNEPAYSVVPTDPDAALPASGLPAFTIHYENDDDGERKLGVDSRIDFIAPADGQYLAVVRDVRGFGGPSFTYELIVRRPRPDFSVAITLENDTIDVGSGREFLIEVDRADGFTGEVVVEFNDVPQGFHISSPIIVQAEQTHAYGVVNATAAAASLPETEPTTITPLCTAIIEGSPRVKQGPSIGPMRRGGTPKVRVAVLDQAAGNDLGAAESAPTEDRPLEITIAPGETIAAVVRVDRSHGFEGEVQLGKDLPGRNLPHGVYIDNVGLNGFLILADEYERKFFIAAAKWTPETSRWFHLKAEIEGDSQASWPVLLHVRDPMRRNNSSQK